MNTGWLVKAVYLPKPRFERVEPWKVSKYGLQEPKKLPVPESYGRDWCWTVVGVESSCDAIALIKSQYCFKGIESDFLFYSHRVDLGEL